MAWAPGAQAIERLRRAAVATRDLVVHTDATRWEVFAKASTTRELIFEPTPPVQVSVVHETGVAVRTVCRGEAGFGAASGIDSDAARVAVGAAQASRTLMPFDPLPPSRLLGTTDTTVSRTLPPSGWAAHAAEKLTHGIVEAADRRLLVRRIVFHEGEYGRLLATGEGFVATHQDATISVLVEMAHRDRQDMTCYEWIWVPDPNIFDADRIARQMCDRALLMRNSITTRSGLFDVLFHPEISAHLLGALAPAFLPCSEDKDPIPKLVDRNGQLAAQALTLVDDASMSDCPSNAPCDGEGLPLRRHLLLENGVPRHRLTSRLEAQLFDEPTRGGARRLSYRDYPRAGISALRVVPDPGIPAAELLRGAGRSLYALRLMAPVSMNLLKDEFRLLTSGVWLDKGVVEGFQPVVELRGALSHLLHRIDAVGADLGWHQTPAGFVAAPTTFVRCLKVVGR
ncbi:MAG: TldD/PmbA family protein [Thermoanaerobaculales bacterium]|nr:TldD/PmbA family protein [Thermoanaerobaculales bacterium]